ncbi:competence/damage-inducible protein A [Cytobacillus sp. S13-E01]|uniref:competence/damage-inducible protein A n=1 Tax=Cytobacillus sp. S13-E01 TaxID=3031326 RepID=UPI0023D7C5E3|nr:competence/damage-inducible protein A [Cytobacillus sp. S13-E01]MDF0725114.1 competence/damage-inducible protein A [Cytobacillus sp. S13-E01]
MNAEIIAVGSELLLGQIVNSNAQFLSRELADIGVNVYYHTVVGDNPSRLQEVIETAQKRSNLLIFTGGLGPTKDDLTKETIASLIGRSLVMDDKALKSIVDYFQKTNRVMTENNKKQALVLKGSTVLRNDNGMAPGMGIEINRITYMLLPGPPKEMNPMFTSYGKKYLLERVGTVERIESRVLRFFGIGESQLETEIEDLIDAQTNPTIAPLASDGEVTLRLSAKHSSFEVTKKLLDDLEKEITIRVGQYLYGYESVTLVSQVLEYLKVNERSIASAESLTGGLFQEQLTSMGGASSVVKGGVVCYSNDAKRDILNVNEATLNNDGAVSEKCAKELADNVRKLFNADIGISFTGVAGPNELEGKPVGTVYIGISSGTQPTKVHKLSLAGSRQGIRERAVKYGYFYLLKMHN